ncbi:hypothetical protein [Micromonospora aurantiaca]|uniref:hypothetical protein n=1 Tax=Micromonospora aurantiaca (nom. illeg.) TaxID=47850 RepID=UPI002E17ACFF
MRGLDTELVVGPAVTRTSLLLLRSALGMLAFAGMPRRYPLGPDTWRTTLDELADVPSGLYLAVDDADRVRWLGKAHRAGGVGARLGEHLDRPERAAAFAAVYVAEADPYISGPAIAAAEGYAADGLQLRGRLGPRTWPSAHNWAVVVGAARPSGARPRA